MLLRDFKFSHVPSCKNLCKLLSHLLVYFRVSIGLLEMIVDTIHREIFEEKAM